MTAVSAVVLAAGLSQRMGRPKMVLPWMDTTVIGQVVRVLQAAGVDQPVVVTGGARDQVEDALAGSGALTVFNPQHANGEMLVSLQVGLQALVGQADWTGTLVALGDQPRMQAQTVKGVLAAGEAMPGRLIVPSYQMRRGHPWLLPRSLWDEVLSLPVGATMRDFLHAHANDILYLSVETDSVLQDLDTPEDYQREHKRRDEHGADPPAPV